MAKVGGGLVSYLKQGGRASTLSADKNADTEKGDSLNTPRTLEYHAEREGSIFRRIVIFSDKDEVLHSLNAEGVADKDCRNAVAVVTCPVVQDALVRPFRFMAKAYMVQRYYPDQGMAYGRSNGAHPADSEGFCIVAGKGVYAVALFQSPTTTARAVPTLHRIVRSLGHGVAAFSKDGITTDGATNEERTNESLTGEDDKCVIEVTEESGPHESRSITL